jgi:ribosomal protein L4
MALGVENLFKYTRMEKRRKEGEGMGRKGMGRKGRRRERRGGGGD